MCRPSILLERFPELAPAFPNLAFKRQVYKCEECWATRAFRYLGLLDDRLHTLVSTLWLMEAGPFSAVATVRKQKAQMESIVLSGFVR